VEVPRVDLTLTVDIERTPKVVQLEGMFDVPESKRRTVDFHFDVPLEEQPWQIGLIVGPSGAGKTSVAKHLFGDHLVAEYDWPERRSVIDGFGDMPVRDAVQALSSVGFSSPPSWTKPYAVLSNGEKFRANMARALVDTRDLVVIDEFTSVVDRTVAQIGSHAIAKAVRRSSEKRFVAVSCHDDIVDWLQPDWVLEPHVGRFSWRSVQRRPPVDLEIYPAIRQAWREFSAHHYLSADIHPAAQCVVATVAGRLAAFCATLPFVHSKVRGADRVHRIVIAPDFQGLGMARVVLDAVAESRRSRGRELRITTSHPGLIAALARASSWDMTRAPSLVRPLGRSSTLKKMARSSSIHRKTAGFRFVGSDREQPETPAHCDGLDAPDVRQDPDVGARRVNPARSRRILTTPRTYLDKFDATHRHAARAVDVDPSFRMRMSRA
jgi:ABC-type molybdenum transport system ATPase subunit/photorepair protein PhrA/GNAT superfamily N-acetyltransferase